MNTLKAVITKDTLTLRNDGVIHLQLSGVYLTDLKAFVNKRKKAPGSLLYFDLVDEESKSTKQNSTYRLLVSIAFKSGLFGNDYDRLHNCFKQVHGKIYKDWQDFAGVWQSDLKSTREYTQDQMTSLISGTIEHMLRIFNENDYYDKRFDEMMKDFNSQDVKPIKEEEELF